MLLAEKFDTLSDLDAWINSRSPRGYFKNASTASDCVNNNMTQFTLTTNYSEARSLMLGGWPEGAKELRAAMIENVEGAPRPHFDNYYYGTRPNIPAYLSNRPRNMVRRTQNNTASQIINIVYNISVACGVKSKAILQTSAKLMNVILGLEANNIRVGLYVGFGANKENTTAAAFVKIKDFDSPLNVEYVAYPMIHPSFLRRNMLAYIERAGVCGKTWAKYGAPIIGDGIKSIIDGLEISGVVFDYYELNKLSETEIISKCVDGVK